MAVAPHRWMYIAPRREVTYIYSVWAIVYLLLRPCEKPNLKINKYSSHTLFLWLLQGDREATMLNTMKRSYQKPMLGKVPNMGNLSGSKLAALPQEEWEAYVQRSKEVEYTKVYRTNPNVSLRQIGDEWILIFVSDVADYSNGVLSINEISHFLWEQFTVPTTIPQVLAKAREVYADPNNCMEMEIRNFVIEYVKSNLIIEEE